MVTINLLPHRLDGSRHGRLTITRVLGRRCLATCDCGVSKQYWTTNITGSKTTSCGCREAERLRPIRPGDRFGRLVAIAPKSRRTWTFLCDCGKECVARSGNAISGNTRSCGCLLEECRHTNHLTHGATSGGIRPAEYGVWIGMRRRCFDHEHPKWKHAYPVVSQRGGGIW